MKYTATLESIWNASVASEGRDPEPRDYLWASELGKAPIDLYLRLKGTPESNPPNMRSLRKFDMGNTHEFIINTVLERCGLLVDSQKKVRYQYPGLMMVSGKIDQLFGGKIDYEKAKSEIKRLRLPEQYILKAKNLLEVFSKEYPEGVKETLMETKSTSAFMFDVYAKRKSASENHRIQLFHYLKSEGRDIGHLAYVSRDDGRMIVLPVTNPGADEALYKNHIKTITDYYHAGEQPPKEEMIVFDSELLSFKDNWKVKYSPYLTLLYDFKSQMEYESMFKPMVSRFNRVVTRIAKGDKMTANNLEAIKEMQEFYPDFEKHIPEIKKKLKGKKSEALREQKEREAVERENLKRAEKIRKEFAV